jgi:hypothetical protein
VRAVIQQGSVKRERERSDFLGSMQRHLSESPADSIRTRKGELAPRPDCAALIADLRHSACETKRTSGKIRHAAETVQHATRDTHHTRGSSDDAACMRRGSDLPAVLGACLGGCEVDR